MILLGIIPGPSEPTHDMNTLLVPLVKELTKLWAGVTMTVCTDLQRPRSLFAVLCFVVPVMCQQVGRFAVFLGIQPHVDAQNVSQEQLVQ